MWRLGLQEHRTTSPPTERKRDSRNSKNLKEKQRRTSMLEKQRRTSMLHSSAKEKEMHMIPLDNARRTSFGDIGRFIGRRRRSSASAVDEIQQKMSSTHNSGNLKRVKEIQDRVHKAVTDYEDNNPNMHVTDKELLFEIQENLRHINDDMLRINVSHLVDKYRAIKKLRERDMSVDDGSSDDKKKELLESVQSWMNQDRLDDIIKNMEDDYALPDASVIENYLKNIQSKIQKIAMIQQKILKFKEVGNETTYLERQKENLEKEVEDDILENQYKYKNQMQGGSNGSQNSKEFSYLKNAATEIYDLVQRTRMEGMAHSSKFEEELKEILTLVEDKDRHIEHLENRIEQQKRLVSRWCSDYEKLQNEHILSRSEAITERKSNRRLSEEIVELKTQLRDAEKLYQKNYISKREHEDLMADVKEVATDLKQKLDVALWSLKEKSAAIEELQRNIKYLKSSLRKGSSGFVTEVSSSSAPVEEQSSLSNLVIAQSEPTGSLNAAALKAQSMLQSEVTSLKERLKTLERENMKLQAELQYKEELLIQSTTQKQSDISIQDLSSSTKPESLHTYESATKPHHSVLVVPTEDKSIQTLAEAKISLHDASTMRSITELASVSKQFLPEIETVSIGVQTSILVSKSSKTITENDRRRSLYVAEKMHKQFGEEWKNAVNVISKVSKKGIDEIDKVMSCEKDYKTILNEAEDIPIELEEEGVEEEGAAERISLTSTQNQKEEEDEENLSENLSACKVTDDVANLAVRMLEGDDPQNIRENTTAGINEMLHEAEGMSKKIGKFVDKIQGYIGCQTGMMQEVNDMLKKYLPADVVQKLERQNGEGDSSSDLSCDEHSQEWKGMSIAEQIRCKLKLVEEAMQGMVKETMDVFIGEVAKQHADYNDIHITVKDENDLKITKIVPNPKEASKEIQNHVEASVRYMTRLNRVERMSFTASPPSNDVGLANLHGRQVGSIWRPFDKFEHANTPVSMFSHKQKVGADALEGLITRPFLLTNRKNTMISNSPPPRARHTYPRNIQLSARQTRNKWKTEFSRRARESSSAKPATTTYLPDKLNITANWGRQEFQTQPQHNDSSRRRRNQLTIQDVQNELNDQFQMKTIPKQGQNFQLAFPKHSPNAQSFNNPNAKLLVSHFHTATPIKYSTHPKKVFGRDLKLPKLI